MEQQTDSEIEPLTNLCLNFFCDLLKNPKSYLAHFQNEECCLNFQKTIINSLNGENPEKSINSDLIDLIKTRIGVAPFIFLPVNYYHKSNSQQTLIIGDSNSAIYFRRPNLQLSTKLILKRPVMYFWLSHTGQYCFSFPSQFCSIQQNVDWWDLKDGTLKNIIPKAGSIDPESEINFSSNDHFILVAINPEWSEYRKAVLIDTINNTHHQIDLGGPTQEKNLVVRCSTIFEDEKIIVFQDQHGYHGYSAKERKYIWTQPLESPCSHLSSLINKIFVTAHLHDNFNLFIHSINDASEKASIELPEGWKNSDNLIIFFDNQQIVITKQTFGNPTSNQLTNLYCLYDKNSKKQKIEEKLPPPSNPLYSFQNESWNVSSSKKNLTIANLKTKEERSYPLVDTTIVPEYTFCPDTSFLIMHEVEYKNDKSCIALIPLHELTTIPQLLLRNKFIDWAHTKLDVQEWPEYLANLIEEQSWLNSALQDLPPELSYLNPPKQEFVTINTKDFREQGEQMIATLNQQPD